MHMQTRTIKKQVWVNQIEAKSLLRKAKKAGLTEAALIRFLVSGYEPKEKPDDRFYEYMRHMSAIGNSLNQIARKANAIGYIDAPRYDALAKEWQQFRLEVREHFLLPERDTS